MLQVDPDVRGIHNSWIEHLLEFDTVVIRQLGMALEPKVITSASEVSFNSWIVIWANLSTSTTFSEPTQDNKQKMTLTS